MKHTRIFALLLWIGVFIWSAQVHSQQVPLFSQYYYNPFIYNPGFAGMNENPQAFLLHRSQWKNIQGAPVTYGFTVNGRTNQEKIGLGLSIFNDQTDIFNRTHVGSHYSYKIQVSGDHYLYPGLTIGFIDNRIDFNSANPKDVNDPMLISASRRKIVPDASFGLAYEWKQLKAGIVAKQLLGNKITLEHQQNNAYFRLKQHLIFTVLYDYNINDEISIIPNALVYWVQNAPLQFDIATIARWKNLLQGGVFFRYNYAFGVNLGVKVFENLFASYSYEYMLLPVGSYTGGGHEFVLGYTFGGNNKKYLEEQIKKINDDLDQNLLNTQDQIDELKRRDKKQQEEIDSLKNAVKNLPTQTQNHSSSNTTSSANNSTADIQKEKRTDYTDETGATVEPGFYVIIESFKDKSNAEKAKEHYLQNTNFIPAVIHNKVRKFYYISILYSPVEEEARNKLIEARQVRSDSWIFLFE